MFKTLVKFFSKDFSEKKSFKINLFALFSAFPVVENLEEKDRLKEKHQN